MLLGWSDATVRMYEPAPSDEQQRGFERGRRSTSGGTCSTLSSIGGRSPADDLLSALLDATIDGERLTDDQIASTAMVLLMAGHEAVVNATANGIALLAAHPDQWRHIACGEVEPRAAIEEILRFDPPLQWFSDGCSTTASRSTGSGSRAAPGSRWCWQQPTAIHAAIPTLNGSTSLGRTRPICRSAAASISASAHRWHGSSSRRRSPSSPGPRRSSRSWRRPCVGRRSSSAAYDRLVIALTRPS